MDEIVLVETKLGTMEPQPTRLKKVIRFLEEDFPTERVLDLILGAALWGMAAWGLHEFLERISASMGAA